MINIKGSGRRTIHHHCKPNCHHQSEMSVNMNTKLFSQIHTVGSTATIGAAAVGFSGGVGSIAGSGTIGGSVGLLAK